MNRSTAIVLFAVIFVTAATPFSATADSTTKSSSTRGRLSQISFDEVDRNAILPNSTDNIPARPRTGVTTTKKTLLPASPYPKPAKQASRKIMNNSDQARGMLSRALSTDQLATENFLLPRVKGPFSDKDARHRITSKESWKAAKPGQCAQAINIIATCEKAKALRETLYRFSGNNEYFDRQCAMNSCDVSDELSVPQGLNIPDLKGGSFKLIDDNGSCRYELQRTQDGNWLMLKPSRVSCVCLPKSCLAF